MIMPLTAEYQHRIIGCSNLQDFWISFCTLFCLEHLYKQRNLTRRPATVNVFSRYSQDDILNAKYVFFMFHLFGNYAQIALRGLNLKGGTYLILITFGEKNGNVGWSNKSHAQTAKNFFFQTCHPNLGRSSEMKLVMETLCLHCEVCGIVATYRINQMLLSRCMRSNIFCHSMPEKLFAIIQVCSCQRTLLNY